MAKKKKRPLGFPTYLRAKRKHLCATCSEVLIKKCIGNYYVCVNDACKKVGKAQLAN